MPSGWGSGAPRVRPSDRLRPNDPDSVWWHDLISKIASSTPLVLHGITLRVPEREDYHPHTHMPRLEAAPPELSGLKASSARAADAWPHDGWAHRRTSLRRSNRLTRARKSASTRGRWTPRRCRRSSTRIERGKQAGVGVLVVPKMRKLVPESVGVKKPDHLLGRPNRHQVCAGRKLPIATSGGSHRCRS